MGDGIKETLASLLRDRTDPSMFRIASRFIEDRGPGTIYNGDIVDDARDRLLGLSAGSRHDLVLLLAAFAMDVRDLAAQRDDETEAEWRARLVDDALTWIKS